jgi:hypothetical protein
MRFGDPELTLTLRAGFAGRRIPNPSGLSEAGLNARIC